MGSGRDENAKGPVTDLSVVALRNTNNMAGFTEEFMKAISLHRHWARQPLNQTLPAKTGLRPARANFKETDCRCNRLLLFCMLRS